jgi:hypothetical protein
MRSQTEFYVPLISAPDHGTAEKVFDLVWRFDFTAPGFCLLDIGSGVDSHALRSWMVDLKERLSEIGMRRGRRPFLFRSMGHFDQQETTKFHLDGAPAESMLLLGYEPSIEEGGSKTDGVRTTHGHHRTGGRRASALRGGVSSGRPR